MEIYILDIWLEKLKRGWSLDDVPNEEIKEAIRNYRSVGAKNTQCQITGFII